MEDARLSHRWQEFLKTDVIMLAWQIIQDPVSQLITGGTDGHWCVLVFWNPFLCWVIESFHSRLTRPMWLPWQRINFLRKGWFIITDHCLKSNGHGERTRASCGVQKIFRRVLDTPEEWKPGNRYWNQPPTLESEAADITPSSPPMIPLLWTSGETLQLSASINPGYIVRSGLWSMYLYLLCIACRILCILHLYRGS